VEKNSPGGDDDRLDNLPTGCTEIGDLQGVQMISGTVSDGADDLDYFCLQLTGIASLTVQFGEGPGSEADVYEYADAVKPSDKLGSTFNQTGAWDLLPGRYLIGVYTPGFGGGDYEIALSSVSYGLDEPTPEPGDTTDRALRLMPATDLTWTDGYVGKQDATDLYRVEVPSGQELNIQLDHVGSSAQVKLSVATYSAVPIFPAPAIAGGPGLYTLMDPLSEGDYLLQVSGAAPYHLGTALSAP